MMELAPAKFSFALAPRRMRFGRIYIRHADVRDFIPEGVAIHHAIPAAAGKAEPEPMRMLTWPRRPMNPLRNGKVNDGECHRRAYRHAQRRNGAGDRPPPLSGRDPLQPIKAAFLARKSKDVPNRRALYRAGRASPKGGGICAEGLRASGPWR